MPRMMQIKIRSIMKFLVDRNCRNDRYVSKPKITGIGFVDKLFRVQQNQLLTWLTVSFSLTLVFLRSALDLSTCKNLCLIMCSHQLKP